jgi:outer membrane lipoprotein carrier protein
MTSSRRLARALGAATAALALATTAAPATAQARGDVDALIARAAATYKAARTATARFEQTLTNPMTGSETVSRGVLQRQQPDRFNFQFTDPRGDRMVADGQWLWVYTPSTAPRQVIKLPIAAAGAGAVDPGLQFFESPGARFTIADGGTATVSGQRTRVLTLTPKKPIESFTKATVWLDPQDGTLRQFETLDGMGVKRRVRLMDLQVNVPVAAASFRFTPPAGVRVVDQAGLMGSRP